MDSLFNSYFAPEDFCRPYEDGEEYLADLMRKNELSMVMFLSCAGGEGAQPLDRFKGLVVTPGQVRQALSPGDPFQKDRALWEKRMEKADFYIETRLEKPLAEGMFFAPLFLREVFHLTDLEQFGLLLSLMPGYDDRYGGIFALLQDDVGKTLPEFLLMLRLFCFEQDMKAVLNGHQRLERLERKARLAFLRPDSMQLDRRIQDFLLQNGGSPLRHRFISVQLPGKGSPLPVLEDMAAQAAAVLSGDSRNEPLYFCLKGEKGSGRRTIAGRAAELLDLPAVFFSCEGLSERRREDFLGDLYTAGREAVIQQGIIVVCGFELLLEELSTAEEALGILGSFCGSVLILVEAETVTAPLAAGRRWIERRIPALSRKESAVLWERELRDVPMIQPAKGWELAGKFRLLPGQIAGSAAAARLMSEFAPLTPGQLTEAVYQQVSHKLSEHAALIEARHTWEQLVLADTEKEMLRNACSQVRYQHIVYDEWGFDKRLAYGKGVSMLFAGPPGTGKTMAAQVVSGDLGLQLYKVDLSQVVSKYIGETEKNLSKVFDEAKKSSAILFFDETDAILGKRTEVKDSHDKNANLETAFLLQKMEEYDGITIMTTNYKENIDSAFFRRISYVIHFSLPDETARKAIWQGIFPKETPLRGDLDFGYLAAQFAFSGGSIKNIALTAAFLAAEKGEAVGMRQIVKAIQYEMAKQGKIMLRDDYGEYGFLVK